MQSIPATTSNCATFVATVGSVAIAQKQTLGAMVNNPASVAKKAAKIGKKY